MISISNENVLLSVVEESLYLHFVENKTEDFFIFLVRKYPDDYLKAGKRTRDLSKQEKSAMISLLELELRNS